MKILQAITLADLGGAQSVLINLSNKAVENGHEVYVVSEQHGAMWNLLSPKIHKIKIKELQRSISVTNDFKAFVALRKIYKQIKPDIVHLHSSKMGALGRLAFPTNKIIYTVHGFDSVRHANPKFLIIEKLLKSRVKNIVAVSEYDKNILKKEGIEKSVVTIYNGIQDVDTAKMIVPNINFDSLKKDFKIVMCIARLSPQKKFGLFCEIAEKMSNEKVKFIWIGNKEEVKLTKDNILMLGEIANAQDYLRYADLFILPSNYEGLPISIIESLAYKKPIIASKVGGIVEILNGKNGFAIENHVDCFVDKIKYVLLDEERYSQFCINARSTYELQFTIDQMYNNYLKLYKTNV
ncbi:glycosyltransferase [Kaistella sp. BT6-1-3]|uniref:Glycosyltransferase n=1 Tax=Kaistella yananensis TaxID=2989820 RepID=A0ABT3JJH7_9FLAO|nr:glycosyltransferase [Kaistella yananensis]MCW4450824.1 glycosyltransferase [Kaistella yananensis]